MDVDGECVKHGVDGVVDGVWMMYGWMYDTPGGQMDGCMTHRVGRWMGV